MWCVQREAHDVCTERQTAAVKDMAHFHIRLAKSTISKFMKIKSFFVSVQSQTAVPVDLPADLNNTWTTLSSFLLVEINIHVYLKEDT